MEMPIQYPYFAALPLSDIEREYVFYHTPRYDFILSKVKQLLEQNAFLHPANVPAKILDFGPHFLTQILREETGATVDQLGWRYDSISRLRTGEKHIDFDLNRTPFVAEWPHIEPQDIIVACEIIEHVYTSPNYVLPFIYTCVKPNGFLIIQTPNAVSLKHRLTMIAGKNPYELIRETLDNPGHFREYTKTEMVTYAAANGFELVDFGCYSYFNYVNHGWIGRAYKFLSAVLPASLRDNMTLVFRRIG